MKRKQKIFLQELFDPNLHTFNFFLRRINDEKIIAISQIRSWFQAMLYESVQFMEIDIGKNLTREISDRDTFLWKAFETGDDLLTEVKRFFIIHNPLQELHQAFMVHMIEKFMDICAIHKKIRRSKKRLCSLNGLHKSFSFSTRPGIEMKAVIKKRIEVIVHQTMDNPIPYTAHGNESCFVVRYDKMTIWAMLVGVTIQIPEELKEISF